MWAEARKQEKRIKGMMVDLKKRAERRKDFYEKIKADPVQFLQVHGRSAKINLDPFIAQAAEHPQNMMPLLGDASNMIDRFDARSHLDFITEYKPSKNLEKQTMDDVLEERRCNYERYRLLVHLDSLEIKESQHLKQIKMEEQYPEIRLYEEEKKRIVEEKKKKKQKSAAIGYTYEENESEFQIFPPNTTQKNGSKMQKNMNESESSDTEPEDDVHTSVVDAKFDLDLLSIHDIQRLGTKSSTYGILPIDFIQMVDKEKEDKAMLRLNKEMEEEKAMFAGKKARRERRMLREQRLRRTRRLSPPAYANRDSPSYDPYMAKPPPTSPSKSPSPVSEREGAITYITSFGGEGGQNSDSEINLNVPNKHENNSSIFKTKNLNDVKEKQNLVGVEQGPVMPPHILKAISGGRRIPPYHHRDRDALERYPEGIGPRVMGVLRGERHSDSRHRRSRDRKRRSRSRDSSRRRRRSRSRRDDRRSHHRRHPSSRHRSRDSRRRHSPRRRKRTRSRSLSRKHHTKKSSPPHKSQNLVKFEREKIPLPKEAQPKPTTPPVPIIPTTSAPLLAHPFQKIVYEGEDRKTATTSVGWDIMIGAGGGDKVNFKQAPPPRPSQSWGGHNVKKRYRRASLSSSSPSSLLVSSDSDSPSPDSNAKKPQNHNDNDRSSRNSSSNRSSVSCNEGQNARQLGGKRESIAPSKKLTLLERMKRQTALALNKIQKEDKKAMVERTEKQENERLEREEELRLLTLRIRRRDRDRRHSDGSESSPHRSKSKSLDGHAKTFHRSRNSKGSGYSSTSSDD